MTATPDADAGKAQGKERPDYRSPELMEIPDKCPCSGHSWSKHDPSYERKYSCGCVIFWMAHHAPGTGLFLRGQSCIEIMALRAANARLAEELAGAKAKLSLPCECCTSLDDERERSNQLCRVIEKIAARLGIDRDNDPVVDEALSEHTEDDEECWGIDAMHRLIVERIAALQSQLAALRQQEEAMVPRDVALRACEVCATIGWEIGAQTDAGRWMEDSDGTDTARSVDPKDAHEKWDNTAEEVLDFAMCEHEAAQRGAQPATEKEAAP